MNTKRILAFSVSAVLMLSLSLSACGTGTSGGNGGGTSGTDTSGGQVYFQNFKPEQDEAYQAIAKEYTAETGVPVKVITAASGTYEQTLRSEIAKNDAPTIFQINGPVGYAAWKDYTADLSGSDIYGHLSDKSLAITGEDGGVYGVPFAIEGYGIIVNNKIAAKYFALNGAKAASLDEINTFAKLKAVVEDMQAKKTDLGIEGVFASTSLKPGEDWRWQTHLMNVPIYCEWSGAGADLSDPAATDEIKFQYNENFKNIFDLYLNNSTIVPTVAGSKTVDDSMAEFALGKAVMVQNGNWAYGQISGVDGNTVEAADVTFIPIYIGAPGEEKQGLCIGTENFFCINKNASEVDQKASLDFLNWLYTSDAGKAHVTNDLGFIAPFDSFTDADKPSDPLGQQVMDWSAKSGIQNVPWNFTVFPSQQFKDNFGGYLLLYAQGQMDWNDVSAKVITDWTAEKAAAQ
ncbi:MAG: ABC transporter substrate-binding protein [Clostridiales Family XIII bacterium]|jgi:raffinose/stachyose/melibiose transport system substrate-binding protein|nr:ABC transporter substrate-binding protein [Clostridiales Family XIII bacterium]